MIYRLVKNLHRLHYHHRRCHHHRRHQDIFQLWKGRDWLFQQGPMGNPKLPIIRLQVIRTDQKWVHNGVGTSTLLLPHRYRPRPRPRLKEVPSLMQQVRRRSLMAIIDVRIRFFRIWKIRMLLYMAGQVFQSEWNKSMLYNMGSSFNLSIEKKHIYADE